MYTFFIIIILILIMILILRNIIKIFILNNLIILRGILGPNCYWYNISDKLLLDRSGINLFYEYKNKYGRFPSTHMFFEKIHLITEKEDVKYILDNSPELFGVGKLKYKFFKSFMKDNVGVSHGCPWKKRRKVNEYTLETNKLHQFSNLYNQYTKYSINLFLKKKLFHIMI